MLNFLTTKPLPKGAYSMLSPEATFAAMSDLFQNTDRTELSLMGEFGLIEHLTKNVKIHNTSTLKGIGDDGAVIDHGTNKTVVSTDLLVEGVHFDLMYVPLKHLGYKAIMVNLSDICAMNASPTQVTVSIGVSNRFGLEALEELYAGMLMACDKWKVDLIGGDTCSSQKGLIISVTAIGEAREQQLVYRSGAQTGDLLCVSGDLGGAYVGLQMLEREKAVFLANPHAQPELDGMDYILERQLKPEARMDVVELLKAIAVQPTSMIDVSDGLASEILHLAKSSSKGFKLYEEKIPIDPITYESAREINLDPTVCALNGGEDYELLFTIRQLDYEKLKGQSDISVIGHVTEPGEGCMLISKGGSQHELKAQGWNAFSSVDRN